MLCHICHTAKAAGPQSYFGHHYIPVCDPCHAKVQACKNHPYSKVMDAVALAETGYYLDPKKTKELTKNERRSKLCPLTKPQPE